MALIDKLTAVADAIRAKTGRTDLMTLDRMAEEIEAIEAAPDGSATTFGNVDGAPAEREEAYAILSEDLNALGAITQTMSGKKALMTVAEMVYWLNRVQYIPQGNAESVQSVSQISVATGIVPTVYRGSAISIQSVSNVSTAVGSLVESA